MNKIKKTKFRPDYAIPPGATLKELLKERNISESKFASETGLSLGVVQGIIFGEIEITPEIAKLFEKVLRVPASFWRNRERSYRKTLTNK